MPFFDENPTDPRLIARRLTRALAQNRAARTERVDPTCRSYNEARVPSPVRHDVGTTVDATIRPVGSGRYRRLGWAPGEPHLVRDAFGVAPAVDRAETRRSLVYFVQHTDLHICDAQAEARIVAGQAFGWLHPGTDAGHRPQETMTTQVFDQLVRATNAIRISPLSGAPMAWCAQTGDHTDNRAAAEVHWWLDVLAGRTVTPNTGTPGVYEGVHRSGWKTVWNPDRCGQDRPQRHGHPYLPGVLDAAVAPFDAEGLAVPWWALQGNHDQIFVGTFGPMRGFRIDLVEPMVRYSGLAPLTGTAFLCATFVASATGGDPTRWARWGRGPGTLAVTPDPDARRPIGDAEFAALIAAQSSVIDSAGAGPADHGPSANGSGEWFSIPEGDLVQIIALDTRNHTAGEGGRLGPTQTAWLEQELARHHRRWIGPDGSWVEGDGPDRLVVVMSHHNSWVMDNSSPDEADPGPATDGEALVELLGRFPNVILWFNGHSHQHRIAEHHSGHDPRSGFWEVSTSSLAGFPQQGRTFELFDNGDDTVSIITTVVDHAGPPAVPYPARDAWTPAALASLSRELAVNDDRWFDPMSMLGTIDDRNVELVVAKPFAFG